jgi:hypothetical protein
MQLAAQHRALALSTPESFRRRSMPSNGAVKYSHAPVHTCAGSADATVRAGFMLMPDTGASNVMYSATSVPAKSPV